VLLCGRQLEPLGDWYFSLTSTGGVRRLSGHQLSATQRAVAEMAHKGMTNDEIAHALEVSASTVKYHLSTLFDVLDITSRVELAAALREHPAALEFAEPRGNGGAGPARMSLKHCESPRRARILTIRAVERRATPR
jgi:DNA-binding CsgD family transcriptional regulator